MRAVIIDDESDAVYTLDLIIKEYWPEISVVGKFTDPGKALVSLPIIKPDLVFLDINMPVMSGFELLQNLESRDFNLVFTTAYDEFALKAFKYNAIDYLLKPIDLEELSSTIKRLKEKTKDNKLENFDFKKILEEITARKEDKIVISTAENVYFLKQSEIVYLLASSSMSKIIRVNGDIIFVSKTLKELETIVGSDFLRVHHSYIINIKFIKMLVKDDNWSLMMDNGDKIPIARRKKAEIVNLISQKTGGNINI